MGWQGIKNGELLRRARGRFEVLVTMDRNLEFQQNIVDFEGAMLLLRARSNRMIHLRPLVPGILAALNDVQPGEVREIFS